MDAPVNTPTNLALIRRLLGLGLQHKWQLGAALLVTVIMQIMAVGELVSSGLAVDVLRKKADPSAPSPQWPLGFEPPADWSFMNILTLAAGAAFFFALFRAVGYFLARWTDEVLAQAVIVDVRVQVYEQLQRLPFTFFDEFDSGTIINRVTADVHAIRTFIQGVLIRAITSVVTLIVFLTAMFSIHTPLTLACITLGIFQIIIVFRYARRARPEFRKARQLIDGVISKLSEGVQGVRVIRAFGKEQQQIESFADGSQEARDQRLGIWKMVANHMMPITGISWIQVAILIGYGGYLVQVGPDNGGIALGAIWIFFGLMRTMSTELEAIIRVAATMPDSLTAAERVFEILDIEPDIQGIQKTTGVGGSSSMRGEIELRNVNFSYNTEDDEPILHNVSLHIQPGENVAIVGPTGSGKTTLLQLIPRFYDPQEGQVLIDGIDLREWDLAELRRSIGIVFQEPYLFSNSIAANVAFGRPHIEMAAIESAAASASADEFIEELKDGYDTIVGERGMMLSGGERQRLSLARALLVDPVILIMDDAMSAVDAGTETAIQAALDSTLADRTALVVAHRLSTLRRADRVVVLEKGRIVAEGSHEQLMATDGHYRDAAIAQLHDEANDDSSDDDRSATS